MEGHGEPGPATPPHDSAAEAPEPPVTPASEPRRTGLLGDWERTVAVTIGIVTLTAALLTYLAVLQQDASSDARGQATLETLQVQRQELIGAIRVQGERSAADHYRSALAQAEALEAQATTDYLAGRLDRAADLYAEAQAQRYVANSSKETSFDATRLTGTGSAATYDVERRLDTIQGYDAFNAIEPDQPEHTAQVAGDRHDQSVRTLLCVLLLLLLAVLLTVGRILSARTRGPVLVVSVVGWLAACGLAVANAVAG